MVIDADLQDPPELIATFVQKWREGYQVVYGVRQQRHGEQRPHRVDERLLPWAAETDQDHAGPRSVDPPGDAGVLARFGIAKP